MALRLSSLHRQMRRAFHTGKSLSVVNPSGHPSLTTNEWAETSFLTTTSSSTLLLRRGLATTSTSSADRRGQNSKFRRRKRPNYGKIKDEGTGPPKNRPERTGLDEPYAYGGAGGESTEDYLKKTSLSPWVPIPDVIARKLFDMSAPTPDDIHVDLGCGDGRVNFHAIDHGKVKKSTGIDVDDGILEKARERLGKRYPQPPIEFITADLLDYSNNEVWGKIQEATIITMYFVEDALQQIRPLLEEKLAGRECKIITCAYEMKGWTHTIMETTLGTTVYLYNWPGMGDDDEDMLLSEDDILIDKPKELLEDPLAQLKGGRGNVEHIKKIWAFLPDRNRREPGDDWTDDEDEEEEKEDDDEEDEGKVETEANQSKSKSPSTIKKAPCSRN